MFKELKVAALLAAFVFVSQVFAVKTEGAPEAQSAADGPPAKRRKVMTTQRPPIVTRSMSRRMVAPPAGERNNTLEIPVVAVPSPPIIIPVPDQICIFEGVKLPPDFYEVLYDVLDLKSFLALGSTSKSVRAKIAHHIMQRDSRKLHLIRWQEGPIPRPFQGHQWTGAHVNSLWFNYLLNKSVYTLQKYTIQSGERYTNASGLAQPLACLGDHVARLGPLGQDILRVFQTCHNNIVHWRTDNPNTLPFYGKVATSTPGFNRPERDMAFFMAFLSKQWVTVLKEPENLMGLVAPGLYYDAPLSHERRSVVERYLRSKPFLQKVDPLVTTTASVDSHLEKAKLWAQLFEEEVVFTPDSLEKFTEAIDRARQPLTPDLASSYYKAVKAHQEAVITRWTPGQRGELCRALRKIWAIDRSRVGYILQAREIMEEVLRRLGDDATVNDIKYCEFSLCDIWDHNKTWTSVLVRALELSELVLVRMGDKVTDTELDNCAWCHFELWKTNKTLRHNMQRCVDLYERELDLLGDKVSAYELNDVAWRFRAMWQADSSRTDLLVRAVGLVERRYDLLEKEKKLRRADIIGKGWYYLQHSRVDSKMEKRRLKSKKLWEQSLKMNEDIGLGDVVDFLKELNQEFASASAEVKGTEKS